MPDGIGVEEAIVAGVPLLVRDWMARFVQGRWNGKLTLHFNNGRLAAIEPQPTLKLTT